MKTVYDILLQAQSADHGRQVPGLPVDSPQGGVEGFIDSLAKPYNRRQDADSDKPNSGNRQVN